MIKVLIIEDEFLVRVGLKTFISWEDEGFELINEASNGVEALRILEQSSCDLLLTDINMPEMDGLTLLQHVKERYPHMKSIILSNHDDFHYVRTALQIGALDYVLKLTMEPQELLAKLRVVQKQIEQERSEVDRSRQIHTQLKLFKKEVREKRFYDIITRACSKQEIHEVLQEFQFPHTGIFHIVTIQIDHYQQVLEEDKFKSEKLLLHSVANIMTEVMKQRCDGELVLLEAGKFTLLVIDYKELMLEELRDSIKRYLKLDISCGVSRSFESIYELHHAYIEADQAMRSNFYGVAGKIAHYEAGKQETPVSERILMRDDELLRLLEQRNEVELAKLLAELGQQMRQDHTRDPADVKEQWVKTVHCFSQVLHDVGGDIYSIAPYKGKYPFQAVRSAETLDEIVEWMQEWLSIFFHYLNGCADQQWRPEIQHVAKLIKEQYCSNIKLGDLAQAVGYSESYLSVLYKKETGETVMETITRHRLQKAKELLKDRALKIYEISDAIGYSDPNYFGKFFKKMEGIYPQEYRKMYFNI
ncbi:response regulator [Paenibacillaceae bacterium]|nr:response regulator [Paenibacillaceae bacterium]